MDFSPQSLRDQFAELSNRRVAIDVTLDPLRAALDRAGGRDMSEEAEQALRQQIRALQEQLYPIEQQRAAIARALDGKTGLPDAIAEQIDAANRRNQG